MSLTDKQLAGNQRRTLRAMRARLLEMAAAWEDLDQFNVNTLEHLADQVEQAAVDITVEDAP